MCGWRRGTDSLHRCWKFCWTALAERALRKQGSPGCCSHLSLAQACHREAHPDINPGPPSSVSSSSEHCLSPDLQMGPSPTTNPPSQVYSWPKAAVTNDHKLCGLKQQDLSSETCKGQTSEIRVSAGLIPLGALRQNMSHTSLLARRESFWLSAVTSSCQQSLVFFGLLTYYSNLCFLFTFLPLLCVSVPKSPSPFPYEDINQ